jgi:hypothetical protein
MEILSQVFEHQVNAMIISWLNQVTSIVARSSRGWCTQHLRRIRECNAHPA